MTQTHPGELQPHDLYELAAHVKENAYSPYSRIKVGAALRMTDNQVFTGCNVENASYGLAMCAERVAIFKAVAAGYQKGDFANLVLASSVAEMIPCGACLQVISEFGRDIEISFLQNNRLVTKSLRELLPNCAMIANNTSHEQRLKLGPE